MKTSSTPRIAPLVGALLCAVAAHAQNPLPNPGFETWGEAGPQGWTTNNNQFTGQPVSQNATGHGGSAAARGTYLGLIAAPIINTMDASNQPLAITQAYQHFTYYYQLQLGSTQGTEIFTATAVFTDAGGNPVGQAFHIYDRTANTGTWTYADLPIVNSGTPTGVNVTFTLNGPDAVVGSYFVVDDVALDNGANGVEELGQGAALGTAWPVPATDAVNLPFTLDASTSVVIDVLDAVGRTVAREELGTLAPGRYKQVLDVQGRAAGMYTAVLHTARGTHAQRFTVAH